MKSTIQSKSSSRGSIPASDAAREFKSGVGLVQILALGVLVAAMFSAGKKAAVPALLAVVKFIWPFLMIWLVWRLIKGKATSAMDRFKEQMMQAVQQQQGASAAQGKGEVLDLCPKCGVLLTSSHRCSK